MNGRDNNEGINILDFPYLNIFLMFVFTFFFVQTFQGPFLLEVVNHIQTLLVKKTFLSFYYLLVAEK